MGIDKPYRTIAVVQPLSGASTKFVQAPDLLASIVGLCSKRATANWELIDPRGADVILLPYVPGDDRLADWQAQGKLVVPIVEEEQPAMQADFALTYPVRVMQVLNLLNQIHSILSESGPQLKSLAIADEWSLPRKLRQMRQAAPKQGWLHFDSADSGEFWVSADASLYVAKPEFVDRLRAGTVSFADWKQPAIGVPPGHLVARSGSELLWFSCYCTSGRAAPWLDVRQSYKLQRWPDLGSLRATPAVVRVVTMLSVASFSFAELAQRSQLPEEEVLRTLNALAGCDLLRAQERAAQRDNPFAQEQVRSSKDGSGLGALFKNIRRHLGL